MGNISDVVYNQGNQSPALPIAVIVKLDSTYTGPSFFLTYLQSVTKIIETHYIFIKKSTKRH